MESEPDLLIQSLRLWAGPSAQRGWWDAEKGGGAGEPYRTKCCHSRRRKISNQPSELRLKKLEKEEQMEPTAGREKDKAEIKGTEHKRKSPQNQSQFLEKIKKIDTLVATKGPGEKTENKQVYQCQEEKMGYY